ncbi:neurotensin receptor type 1-like [Antedon mediterranea]|uniref:neurotensin receptor type 1-like n=1 Tax=Antedon mediterranea TaxID=105859 RepID=UPI003AF80361
MALSIDNTSSDAPRYETSSSNTSQQYDDLIDKFLFSDWETILRYNIIPVVVALGIVGNTMTFIIIVSKLHKSVYLYLANLAIADTLHLIMAPMPVYRIEFIAIPYTIEARRDGWVCGLLDYFPNSAVVAASLTIFWLSIERYMAVCRPYQFQTSGFGTLSRSVKICTIM